MKIHFSRARTILTLFVLLIVLSMVIVLIMRNYTKSPPVAQGIPILHLYKKNSGECTIVMTVGMHRFANNSCDNDEMYNFAVENPRDGVKFGIYNAGHCNSDESYSHYKILNPVYGKMTAKISVSRAHYVAIGQEVTRGIISEGYKDGQLEGKVSCVYVSADGYNLPHQ